MTTLLAKAPFKPSLSIRSTTRKSIRKGNTKSPEAAITPSLGKVRNSRSYSDIVIPGLLSQLDIGEKFAKFPLENDQIEPHFEDDLSDISPFHRIQLGPMYKYNLQTQLTTYAPYLDILKKNSQLADRNK